MTHAYLARLFPRSLLTRSIALLILLIGVSQIASLAILLHFVQRPRIERTAEVFSAYVSTLDVALSGTHEDSRDAIAAKLGATQKAPVQILSEPGFNPVGIYRTRQIKIFLASLQRHLPPDLEVRWQDARMTNLWIRVHIAGKPYWIDVVLPEAAQGNANLIAVLLSLGLASLAALAGYGTQRYLNRPLQNLANAAVHLSTGDMPSALPVRGPTEIVQVSLAFNQMIRALREAESTRALMLAGVSHDIRTPLTKLRLALAMAENRNNDALLALTEPYLDHVDSILQQFLDYAGSGEREAEQPGDLNVLVSELAADFAGLGHEFELSLGVLPAHAYRPVTMMRLLMNLMQNAVIYGQRGLSIRTWSDARVLGIAVCDRGEGLTAEELERLKAPFQRGSNAEERPGGTGLGLAIVERIATLHHGKLEFHTREGGGLEAHIVLNRAH